MHHHKERKMPVTLVILSLLVICGIAACNWSGGDDRLKKAFETTAIPQQYADYQVLDTNTGMKDYTTVLLAKSGDYMAPSPIRMHWLVNDQPMLAVYRDQEEPEPGYHYYKLDEQGHPKDSLYVSSAKSLQVGFMGPYALHISDREYYYTTWPLDGSHTKIPMITLNKDLDWTPEKLDKMYQEVVRNGQYAFNEPIYLNPDERLHRIFFMKEGKYYVLFKSDKGSANSRTLPEFNALRTADNEFYSTKDHPQPLDVPHFRLRHFQKVYEMKYRHSIGGGSPSFATKGWVGRAFFDINVKNKTIKIRKDNVIIETGTSGDEQMRYYLSNGIDVSVSQFYLNVFTDSRLGYALVSSNARELYLIRPKQTETP